jgi:hypothetical protein
MGHVLQLGCTLEIIQCSLCNQQTQERMELEKLGTPTHNPLRVIAKGSEGRGACMVSFKNRDRRPIETILVTTDSVERAPG